MDYLFWGNENADVSAISDIYPGIKTPYDLYDALTNVWCAETCASRMRDKWSKENKTLGQCSITAIIAQDIFGGDVYGINLPNGNCHCYNVVGDCKFDLTSEQFCGEVLDYDDNPLQDRLVHLSNPEKKQRYELLTGLLSEYCKKSI